jgi:hypothetical protein
MIRRLMAVTCAHCRLDDASCCQCCLTRIVTWAVAEKSAAWAWDFPLCGCAACVRLRHQRGLIEDPSWRVKCIA